MIVSTYEKNGRKAEIHNDHDGNGLYVRLYENNSFVELKELRNYSIHYAESMAENYVERLGSFYAPTPQFIQD